MKSLTSWLIAIFAFMYWGFRVVVAVTSTMGIDFAVTPLNSSWEVPLLFITFICICFIPKRKLIPVLIYLILHGGYYGVDLYNNIMAIINNEAILSSYVTLLSSLIGIAIPLFAFLISLIVHTVQVLTLSDENSYLFGTLCQNMVLDYVFLLVSFISYLWADDVETKKMNKKSYDNSLEWLWKKV